MINEYQGFVLLLLSAILGALFVICLGVWRKL